MKTCSTRLSPLYLSFMRLAFRNASVALAALILVACSSSTPTRKPLSGTAGNAPSASRASKATAEPTYRHVVAADHELASKAGLEILKKGGNAVDAAVATSFALSVVRPYSCGIGGGGFMMIHLKSHPKLGKSPRTIALDYREVAPSWARPDFYETDPASKDNPDASTRGARAVAVPGTVAGLLFVLETYGTLPREVVMAPAIRYAEQGFVIDADYASVATEIATYINEKPARAKQFARFKDIYLTKARVGEVLKQPEQASALKLIAKDGANAFYKGAIASQIRAALREGGVDLKASDLADYKPKELLPLVATFGGKRVFAFPPPSSGGIVLVQTLGMIETRRAEFESFDFAGSALTHFTAEALKHSFADRSRYLADPAFVPIPLLELTSASNIRDLASRIDMTHTQPIQNYGSHLAVPPPAFNTVPKDAGTSHLSVVDSFGNAVACTETINLSFGSLVCVPEFGFVLNDQMDDFTTRVGKPNAFGLRQDTRNLPAPGKQPLSSMSPTIVLSADREDAPVELVVGGSGGPWIITGTLQVMLDSLVFGIPASQAVAQPRMHHQWMPDTLRLQPEIAETKEPGPKGERTVQSALESLGHNTKVGSSQCAIQVIRRSPTQAGRFEAGSDPRKGGKPAGE